MSVKVPSAPPGQTEKGIVRSITSAMRPTPIVSGETRTSGSCRPTRCPIMATSAAMAASSGRCSGTNAGIGVLRAEEEQRREREDAPEAPVRPFRGREIGRGGVGQRP